MENIHTVYEKLYQSLGGSVELTEEEVGVLVHYLTKVMFYNPLADLDSENYNC